MALAAAAAAMAIEGLAAAGAGAGAGALGAGALGAGAGAGGAGLLGTLGPEMGAALAPELLSAGGAGALGGAEAIPAALAPAVSTPLAGLGTVGVGAAPIEMGSGAEALLGGGQLATGSGAAGSTPWLNAFTANGGGLDQLISGIPDSLKPQNAQDWMRLANFGQSLMPQQRPITPSGGGQIQPPRPAVSLPTPGQLQQYVIQQQGVQTPQLGRAGGGLDPGTLNVLTKLLRG